MRLQSLTLTLLAAAALLPACTPRRAHVAPPLPPEPAGGVESGLVAPEPAPIELEVVTELSHRFVLAGKPGEVFARIRIHSPESGDGSRPRANIALVVDTSASMEGDAIVQARQAALTLLGDLHDGDVLSVVAFGSTAEVLLPATELSPEVRPAIRVAIEQMKAWGTTDLAGGLQAGLQQVQGSARTGEINRLVLVSDGVPNDATSIPGLAQQARNGGVPITALGLGLEYHETLLGELARTSGGKFHFVEDPTAVAALFRDEVLSIDRLAARGLSLTLTPGPGVTIVDVPGFGVGHSGRSLVLGLPDLAEGDGRHVIVKLAVGEHRDGANVELLDGVVTYADARTNRGMQRHTFVAARATADVDAYERGVDLDVTLGAARATTAAATLSVVALARSGQLEAATTQLDLTVASAKEISAKMPDADLTRLIDGLVELRPTLRGLVPAPPAGHDPPSRRSRPAVASSPSMGVGSGDGAGLGLSDSGARGVRVNHERAYKTLHAE